MISPLETSIYYWYTWEAQYEQMPTPEGAEAPCGEGDAAAPNHPMRVLTRYKWVRHQTALATQNQAFAQEVDGRLAEADRKALDRARESQRVEMSLRVGADAS